MIDDWLTLRRASQPGAIRTHLASAMIEEGLVKDGDLFHDAFDYALAFHRAMTERDLREHTVEQVLSLTLYTLGEPKPPTDPALARATHRALDRNAAQVHWYDDALPVLNDLQSRRIPLALVTNTIFGLGAPWEERMAAFFPTRVLSREYGFVKPHPGMFMEAARRVGTSPKDCLYVGDLPLADIWGAQQVGMRTVLIDRGDEEHSAYRASDARLAANLGVHHERIRPDHTVPTLRHVLPLVD